MSVTARKPQILTEWQPRPQQGQSKLESIRIEGLETVHLVASKGGTVASFRTSRSLDAGSYVLEAMARTRGLVARDGPPGRGAGIRISGQDRHNQLIGDHDWRPLRFEFELDEEREVEFVIEIRADRGEAWFDLSSLKLTLQ